VAQLAVSNTSKRGALVVRSCSRSALAAAPAPAENKTKIKSFKINFFFSYGLSIGCKERNSASLNCKQALVQLLSFSAIQGDQIKQFFANWATFGGSL
jgi:hypothetical protein